MLPVGSRCPSGGPKRQTPSPVIASPAQLSVGVPLTRFPNSEASIVFPSNESTTRRPTSLHGVRAGRVPRRPRCYQDATTPGRPSRRTWLPSLGSTILAPVFVRTGADVRPWGQGVCWCGTPSQPRPSRMETNGPLRFLGNSHGRAQVLDRGGPSHQAKYGALVLPSAFSTASAFATRSVESAAQTYTLTA